MNAEPRRFEVEKVSQYEKRVVGLVLAQRRAGGGGREGAVPRVGDLDLLPPVGRLGQEDVGQLRVVGLGPAAADDRDRLFDPLDACQDLERVVARIDTDTPKGP